MSNTFKLIYCALFFISVVIIATIMPELGVGSTLHGKFFYTKHYIDHLFMKASAETLTMFLWMEIFDLFVLIPIYTFMSYQVFKIILPRFEQSAMKYFVFFPAAFDVPETVLLIINNAFLNSDPILTLFLPVLTLMKWSFGACLLSMVLVTAVLKIFSVKDISKHQGISEILNDHTLRRPYFKWTLSNLLVLKFCFYTLIILILLGYAPHFSIKFLILTIILNLIYTLLLNRFIPAPEKIFTQASSLFCKISFICVNSIFLYLVLSFLFV